jgi:hypothetical protein
MYLSFLALNGSKVTRSRAGTNVTYAKEMKCMLRKQFPNFPIDMRSSAVAEANTRQIWEIHSLADRIETWKDDPGQVFCANGTIDGGRII